MYTVLKQANQESYQKCKSSLPLVKFCCMTGRVPETATVTVVTVTATWTVTAEAGTEVTETTGAREGSRKRKGRSENKYIYSSGGKPLFSPTDIQ